MNFEDEHYVRIYTRDTKTVKKWGWEGRIVFWELMRKVDKAGVLDDVDDPIEDVALMTELPQEVVAAGLPRLIKTGAIEIRGSHLLIPKYIEGQTASKSDKLRARDSRARRVAATRLGELRDGGDTNRDTSKEGEDVTESDDWRDDTDTNRDGPDSECDQTFDGRPAASPNAVPTQRRSTQCNATQEQPTDPARPIPCPEDLTLADPQIKSLQASGDMIPLWGIQAITEHVVPNWASNPEKTKTLAEWRTYLRATIKNRWKDPKTRPRKPDPNPAPRVTAEELEARERADEAHRQALLAKYGNPPHGGGDIDYESILDGVA